MLTENQTRTLGAARVEALRSELQTGGNATIVTSDATQTTLLSILPEDTAAGFVHIYVYGRSGTDIISAYKVVRAEWQSGTVIGGAVDVYPENIPAPLLGADIDVSVVGDDITVKVTGIAATDIEWIANYDIKKANFSSTV